MGDVNPEPVEVDLDDLRRSDRVRDLRLPPRVAFGKPARPRKPRPDPWPAFCVQVDLLSAALGVEIPSLEYRFHPVRKWLFDLAYPRLRVAIEREGGTHTRRPGRASRHTTGAGYAGDCVKYAEAAILGWIVIRLPTDLIEGKRLPIAIDLIERAIRSRL